MKPLILFFVILVTSEVSQTCMIERPLTDELKSHADFVFEGEAIAYSPSKLKEPGSDMQPAEVTFRVDRVIKGPQLKRSKASWINGTLGESKNLAEFKKSYGTKTKVANIPIKIGLSKVDAHSAPIRTVITEVQVCRRNLERKLEWLKLSITRTNRPNLPLNHRLLEPQILPVILL